MCVCIHSFIPQIFTQPLLALYQLLGVLQSLGERRQMVDLRSKSWESRAPLASLGRPLYRRVSLGNQLLRRDPIVREPFPARREGDPAVRVPGLGDPRPVALLPDLAAGWIPSSQFHTD